MKVISKILLILIIMVATTAIVPQTVVRADGEETEEKVTLMNGVEVGAEFGGSMSEATTGLRSVVDKVLGFLQIASALIAVVMIAVTGFRYIIETPEMKNELKKSMIPIIVGILLVFFATSIAKFFVGMFGN